MNTQSKVPMKNAPKPGAYVKEWKRGIEAAKTGETMNVNGYVGRELSPEQIRPYFLRALERRINMRGGQDAPRGRKDDADAFNSYWRDSRKIQRRIVERVRVYSFETKEARARFSDLLSSYDD